MKLTKSFSSQTYPFFWQKCNIPNDQWSIAGVRKNRQSPIFLNTRHIKPIFLTFIISFFPDFEIQFRGLFQAMTHQKYRREAAWYDDECVSLVDENVPKDHGQHQKDGCIIVDHLNIFGKYDIELYVVNNVDERRK